VFFNAPIGAPDVEKDCDRSMKLLLQGSKKIETAKDEIRRLLSILKPICFRESFISEKFCLTKTYQSYWRELRQVGGDASFFQLWEVVRPGHCDRFWEGFANDTPSTEKVIIVRNAFPFFLSECARKIVGFEEKVKPYLNT